MKNTFTFVMFFLLLGCSSKSSDPSKQFKSYFDRASISESINLDVVYSVKYFSGPDTTRTSAKCRLIKSSTDTVFSGAVWIVDITNNIEFIYDLKDIYVAKHKEQQITIYDDPHKYANVINSNLIDVGFFNSDNLLKEMKRDSITAYSDSNPRWSMKISYPDNPPISNESRAFFLSSNNETIKEILYSVEFQGNKQYNHWALDSIQFDQFTLSDFSSRIESLKNEYKLRYYAPSLNERISPLLKGDILPNVVGKLYGNDNRFNLDDVESDFYLLDFWYMACYPCILSIPHLNDVFNKYDSKTLTVLGLNAIDNSEKSLRRFPKFLNYNNIEYPIVLVDKDVPKAYKIFAYPTLILADKNKQILYTQSGFSESFGKTIDSLISTNGN